MENYAVKPASMPDKRFGFLHSAFAPQQGRDTQKVLYCDVVFGSPAANCRGTGVCKISAHNNLSRRTQPARCRATVAALSAGENGRGATLLLVRELLCVNIVRNHLRHAQLVLNEPCPLPRNIVQKLKLTIHTLRPGIYPVKELDGNYHIEFQ